jgi:hypothetical protein
MLTQHVLLDLLMVLCLAVVPGLGGTFLHRLAGRRWSKPALRLALLLHLVHEGDLRAVVSKEEA